MRYLVWRVWLKGAPLSVTPLDSISKWVPLGFTKVNEDHNRREMGSGLIFVSKMWSKPEFIAIKKYWSHLAKGFIRLFVSNRLVEKLNPIFWWRLEKEMTIIVAIKSNPLLRFFPLSGTQFRWHSMPSQFYRPIKLNFIRVFRSNRFLLCIHITLASALNALNALNQLFSMQSCFYCH